MLQRLERSDRDAELLARLEVVDGHRQRLGHCADGFGGKRGDRLVDGPLDDRQRAVRGAQNVVRRDADVGEADLRRPLAVLGRIAAAGHAGGAGVDEEETDPVGVSARSLHPR